MEAARLTREKAWEDPVIGMRFRRIEPGKFMMGSREEDAGHKSNEKYHEVTITRGFWIAETPVTQAQWQRVTGNNPSSFKEDGERRPVENVTWFDVIAYANLLSKQAGLPMCYGIVDDNGLPPGGGFAYVGMRFLGPELSGYRLPTEAEWEYACRAGSASSYWSGDFEEDLSRAGWFRGNSDLRTQPVGVKDANPWGIYDVHGNVLEWVWDRSGEYPERPATDPIGPHEGSQRVVRGGAWGSKASQCRSAFRHKSVPGFRNCDLGFRLVRTGP